MEHVRTPKDQLHEIPIEFLASFSFAPFGHITICPAFPLYMKGEKIYDVMFNSFENIS